MISTSLLFTIGIWQHLFMIKRHQWRNWRVVQMPSGIHLCQRTIFWTTNVNVYVFTIVRKIKWLLLRELSDLLEISRKSLYFYIIQCRLDWIVQIKFGIRPDIWSDLEDQTEFWTDLACRHVKNLCKLGLRPKFGPRTTKSDVFYHVTQCHNCVCCIKV